MRHTWFKEYPQATEYLESLDWEEIPKAVITLAKYVQERELKRLWETKERTGMSYKEFKSKFVVTVERKQATTTREELSQWEEELGWI